MHLRAVEGIVAAAAVVSLVPWSSAQAFVLPLNTQGSVLRVYEAGPAACRVSHQQMYVPPSSSREPKTSNVLFVRRFETDEQYGTLGLAVTAAGIVANPVVLWSLYTLKTTGCGLPAGPGGSLGALEGISYLVIVGIVASSLYTRLKTREGLPAGPGGLLGAVEGLSYVSLLAGFVIAGLNYAEYGSIPEAVPTEGGRCSNI